MVFDLVGSMARWLLVAQCCIGAKLLLRFCSRVGMKGDCSRMVRSSAYKVVTYAGVGQSARKKLKRQGEITEPWGTPDLLMR